MKKELRGFTLVELLIVMGILAVLMTIGIAVGRFAIQRANDIQHKSVIEQISQGVVSYYNDHRKYPPATGVENVFTPDPTTGSLSPYLDDSLDGGSPATYYYSTNPTQQSYLICVSLGGLNDTDGFGFVCEGNGYGDADVMGTAITQSDVPAGTDMSTAADLEIDWDGAVWGTAQ